MKTKIDNLERTTTRKMSLRIPARSADSLVERPLKTRSVRALLRSGDQGSALVEFALILPMLLLVTTGMLVFGVAMNNYLQLTNAVSIGARTLAASAQLTLDPCATASTAITNAAPGLTASRFTYSFVMNGTPYSGASCSSSSLSSGAASNLSSGTTVTVTATYPLNLSVFGQKFSASNAVLQSTSTELVQ
ncbi:MAG: TadE/TadG family type IV pilus assembly protein [Terracidiphilus sp.]|jgi:Flp pilus assembly protein TadG